jgi:hypothetical protein
LREQQEFIELTPDALVLTRERLGGTIQLETGFASEIWLVGITGEQRSFRLKSLSAAAPANESCFEFPRACPEDREDRSEAKRRQCVRRRARSDRISSFAAMDDALANARVEWSESVRDDAREIFRALHTSVLEPEEKQPSEEMRRWIESYAEWLGAQLEAGHSAEDLHERAAREWTGIEERSLSEVHAQYLAALAADELPSGASAHHDDLLELEASVCSELYEEQLVSPCRQAFEEAVEEALDR